MLRRFLDQVEYTGKRHCDGSMIQQLKWSDGVLNLIQKAA